MHCDNLDLHRLPLPGQIAQTANIDALIRNFRSRTARTSGRSPTSNPENNIPFDLLHGVQYQQLWLGQRPLHNINGLAHNPNIANSSSLHRKCARPFKSATKLSSEYMFLNYPEVRYSIANYRNPITDILSCARCTVAKEAYSLATSLHPSRPRNGVEQTPVHQLHAR